MREFEEHELRCGYAPRSLQYSLNSDTLFIGCKDGTITVVTNLAATELSEGSIGKTVRSYRTSERDHKGKRGLAVRAMCECHPGWLLVGRDGGAIDLLRWHQAEEELQPVLEAPLPMGREDRVTCIEWLDQQRLLISFRLSGTWVVSCGSPPEGSPVPAWIRGALVAARRGSAIRWPGLCGIVGLVPMKLKLQDRWLLFTESGDVWILRDEGTSLEPEELKLWLGEGEGEEIPGFISDFAIVKDPHVDLTRDEIFDYRCEKCRGAYVATDNGVYHLSWEGGVEPGEERVEPVLRRMSLPGLGRICIAITYYADEKSAFLWVSDSGGDAHLFRDNVVGSTDRSHWDHPNWQRSGIRHDASQVMLAIASWRTLAGRFVVGQARRNDYVVISRYRIPSRDEGRRSQTAVTLTPLELLQEGTVETVRAFLEERRENIQGWKEEALLAEFFELLGDDQEGIKSLREFLGNPTPYLALEFLGTIPPDTERVRRALRLWTYALLGTIHRYSQADKESLYLGVIRWLRAIAGPEQAAYIRTVADEQILFVRKWGLFGNSYVKRRSAAVPLGVLLDREHAEAKLDRYAYQSLLFQRQVDLEYENSAEPRAGRTAWDVQTLLVGERLLVAVSWIWGGIELYEVVPEARAEGGGYHLDLCAVLRPEPDSDGPEATFRLVPRNLKLDEKPPPFETYDFGHCRALVLGRLPESEEDLYILACPAQRHEDRERTCFELWRLELGEERVRVVDERRADLYSLSFGALGSVNSDLQNKLERESVYSLVELEEGLILAGLRGQGGTSRVMLVRIDQHMHLQCFSPQEELAASSPAGKAIARNPIWVLARDEGSGDSHSVFAGCADGQVWHLKIPSKAEARQNFKMSPELVERLGAPVWALVCRTIQDGQRTLRRVFAGGADGTILGWQQLPSSSDGRARFTTIWATWEDDGAIARLHLLEPAHNDDRASPAVVAVTQQGRCIVFADRERIEDTRSIQTRLHGRVRVPGERHCRLRLDASAFASALVTLPKGLVRSFGKEVFARLLTATNDGRLRLYTIHYPLHLPQRHEEYVNLVELWLETVCENTRDGTRIFRADSFRMTEAVYVASPVAPQVLVRALLGHRHWEKAPDRSLLDPQWLPHYLRPLLGLHKAWESKDLPAEEARHFLEKALNLAWLRKDRELFVEIMTVVLQRCNHWLVEASDEELATEKFKNFYHSLIDGIERSIKHWLGFPNRAEHLTLISFAKQLTDGDTLWRLGSGQDHERLQKVLVEERIAVIHRLLVTGDPLLALETLRAANLSLIRACKRLVEDGKRHELNWAPGQAGQELPWSALESYVQALSDFAASAFHVSQRVSDSLTHEIARAFALTVCACPSAAIRVAHLIAEADLVSAPDSRANRAEVVVRQVEALGELGAPVPALAARLFRWACTTSIDELDVVERLCEERIQRLGTWQSERDLGAVNQEIIDASRLFKDIVDFLSGLTKQLSGDASNIDLWDSRRLYKRLQERAGDSRDPFRHSRDFWLTALENFFADILKDGKEGRYLPRKPSNRVQPEVVLLSRDINHWCIGELKRLEESARGHKIFQPQYSLYQGILQKLETAAREFPHSSAIQKNIVLGVLSHGLLESLDEHVLELEEIAQALDPLYVWEYRRQGRVQSPDGRSKRALDFSRYILARSHEAESIPKNLRTLQGLLVPRSDDPEIHFSEKDLLLDFIPSEGSFMPKPEAPGWILMTTGSISLSPGELQFLRLTLKELDQNDRNYGYPLGQRSEPSRWPKVWIRQSEGGCAGMTVRFPLRSDEENLRRLRRLKKQGLQNLYPRREARDVASHGTGLYLANLAAAVVNWRLGIEKISRSKKWFEYLLERVSSTGEVRS